MTEKSPITTAESSRADYAATSDYRLFPLPDLAELPAIGSSQRDLDERAVMSRARELVIREDGRLRDALYELERELRGYDDPRMERATRVAYVVAREYARALVDHVEQCWASAVIR